MALIKDGIYDQRHQGFDEVRGAVNQAAMGGRRVSTVAATAGGAKVANQVEFNWFWVTRETVLAGRNQSHRSLLNTKGSFLIVSVYFDFKAINRKLVSLFSISSNSVSCDPNRDF